MNGHRFPAAVVLLLAALPVFAEQPVLLGFRAERIEAPEWRVSDLDAAFEISDSGLRGEIRIGRIELAASGVGIADTIVFCGRVLLTRLHVRCQEASLTAELPILGRQTVDASFDYERQSGVTHFDISRLPLAGGVVRLDGTTGKTGSRVQIAAAALQLAGLVDIAAVLYPRPEAEALAAAGRADVSGSVEIAAAGSLRAQVDATLSAASLSNQAGTMVGDSVNGTIRVDAARDDSGWLFDLELDADHGELYIEPIYANLAEHALHLGAGDVRTGDFVAFDIGRFRLEQDAVTTVSGSARVTLPPEASPARIDSAAIEIVDTSVEAIYAGVLRILAAGTVLGDLETAGRVSGSLSVRDNALQGASFELNNLILDDRKRRFAVYGLDGTLNWPGPAGDPAAASGSRLRWDGASAYNIMLGGAAVGMRLGGDDLVLLEPLRLPTMGGALVINRLLVNDVGTDHASGVLDARLEPIQLAQLTAAFGWPAFSGSLSGRLPLLQYEGNAMTVGGTLSARAFDGEVEFANLRIARPFGRVPRLQADLRLRRLDLERLTNTFSFGLIQGRLSGDVTGLRTVDWRPVAMDLQLYTAPGDRTPHRISQRAVENLASVGGGGAGAALSSGLLRFFEVFAYDRIALRCVLRDGVCSMSGAGPAGDGPFGRGYYIVKGKGLPRIDVIGYRSEVSWQALVEQLSRITRSEAPVVN